MFTHTSRYADLPRLTHRRADGRVTTYAGRRIIPASSEAPLLLVTMSQTDRLDNVAAATLGDPELYWRLCDASGVLTPRELEVAGRQVVVPAPGASRG
jgi:hypothetical protein